MPLLAPLAVEGPAIRIVSNSITVALTFLESGTEPSYLWLPEAPAQQHLVVPLPLALCQVAGSAGEPGTCRGGDLLGSQGAQPSEAQNLAAGARPGRAQHGDQVLCTSQTQHLHRIDLSFRG